MIFYSLGYTIIGDKMFYQFDDEIVSVEASQISDKTLTVGFVSVSELERIYKLFGFSLGCVEKCRTKSLFFSNDVEAYDDYSFARITAVDAKSVDRKSSSVIFVKKNLLLIVSVDDLSGFNRDCFVKLLSRFSSESVTLERLVCSFFEGLVAGDSKELESACREMGELEESVLKSKEDNNFNVKLLKIKNELLILRSFYEQLTAISQAFRENDNDIFDENDTNKFKIFTEKAVSLKENVDLLRAQADRLWDSYQTHLDMKLNQTMKIFTIVTTVFFPLTVIVGWYGMNFKYMPELSSPYGYPGVIALSAAVVFAFIFWFKKKKWL